MKYSYSFRLEKELVDKAKEMGINNMTAYIEMCLDQYINAERKTYKCPNCTCTWTTPLIPVRCINCTNTNLIEVKA